MGEESFLFEVSLERVVGGIFSDLTLMVHARSGEEASSVALGSLDKSWSVSYVAIVVRDAFGKDHLAGGYY